MIADLESSVDISLCTTYMKSIRLALVEMYIWNINLLDGHISFGNIQQCLPHSVKSGQGNNPGKSALE
jgi:hypothetical protein